VKRLLLVVFLLTICPLFAQSHHITTPEEAFGFKPGTDRKLADWKELVAYYQKLASESNRIHFEELGKTTEGRPFVALTISAPENLQHLAEYRDITHKLSDARITSPAQADELIKRGKMILVVTCNIHSTEIASSQSASEFAYRLASSDTPEIQSILHNVILVLVPSLNPDGQQLVVDWYKKYLGTPYEGTRPVVIWHHYTGHDDNRDWYSFTQKETRLTVDKVLNAYHPQLLYDLHQMGAEGPRLYLPPWVDPIDPNVDPLLQQSMNALGAETALDVAQGGRQGVLIHGVYDLWSPARCYMCYHDTLRVLTESASANIASPIEIPFDKLDKGIGYDAKVAAWNFPDPWKGGTWRMGDIVDYQTAAFFSIAQNAAIHRERFLRDYYTVAQHQIAPKDAPYAYIIPSGQSDSAVVARLINILRFGEVEVQQSTADFDAAGQHFPRGSYIIPIAQPFGAFAKTLLEIQHYPNIREYPGGPPQRPYDVTAQTLPLLFNINAVAVQDKFTVPTTAVIEAKFDATVIPSAASKGYLIDDHSNSSLYALFALLGQGVHAYRLTGGNVDPGTIYLPAQSGLEAKLHAVTAKFPLHVHAVDTPPTGAALAVSLPRIALYQSWVPSMDEGWTRWIFDQNNIPYTRVVDADIRKGNLHDRFDVVLIPDNNAGAITTGHFGGGGRGERGVPQPPTPPEYTGGLGPDGVAALDAFTHAGGTIITLNKASEVYAKKDGPAATNALQGVAPKDFYIPGSILEVKVDVTNPIAFGSTATLPIFFEQGPAFHVAGEAKSVASYTSDNPLLSGWILGGPKLNGNSAIVEEPVGEGRLILFGFRPQYRAQSEGTYKLLFNALLYSSSKPATLNGSATAQKDGGKTVSDGGQ
jgi:Zinc carboxypeptidase